MEIADLYDVCSDVVDYTDVGWPQIIQTEDKDWVQLSRPAGPSDQLTVSRTEVDEVKARRELAQPVPPLQTRSLEHISLVTFQNECQDKVQSINLDYLLIYYTLSKYRIEFNLSLQQLST